MLALGPCQSKVTRPKFVSGRESAQVTAIAYEAELDWLEKGFERSMVIADKDGNLAHSEMKFGDGYIMVGSKLSRAPLRWADPTIPAFI